MNEQLIKAQELSSRTSKEAHAHNERVEQIAMETLDALDNHEQIPIIQISKKALFVCVHHMSLLYKALEAKNGELEILYEERAQQSFEKAKEMLQGLIDEGAFG